VHRKNANIYPTRRNFTQFSGSCFRASAMTTMNNKPTRCTIVLKSLKLYCILIPLYTFRALLRPSSGASQFYTYSLQSPCVVGLVVSSSFGLLHSWTSNDNLLPYGLDNCQVLSQNKQQKHTSNRKKASSECNLRQLKTAVPMTITKACGGVDVKIHSFITTVTRRRCRDWFTPGRK
jgi:hypothetical protein